jgi:hypothetical protein
MAGITRESFKRRSSAQNEGINGPMKRCTAFQKQNLRDLDLRDMDLAGYDFRGADLRRVDLRGASLRSADLRRVNLRGANFEGAELLNVWFSGADLRGAFGLPSSPVVWNLHERILSIVEEDLRALDMRQCHGCSTVHSRVGWAIHLAGAEGYLLEENIGPDAAGTLITLASCPWLEKVPDWHVSAKETLADIRRCVEIERSMNTDK